MLLRFIPPYLTSPTCNSLYSYRIWQPARWYLHCARLVLPRMPIDSEPPILALSEPVKPFSIGSLTSNNEVLES